MLIKAENEQAFFKRFDICKTSHHLPSPKSRCGRIDPAGHKPHENHLGTLRNILQASLPIVDNNRKVVGALSVVGEKFSKILAEFWQKIAKISEIFELSKAILQHPRLHS